VTTEMTLNPKIHWTRYTTLKWLLVLQDPELHHSRWTSSRRDGYRLAFSLVEGILGSAAAPGFDGKGGVEGNALRGASVGRQLNFMDRWMVLDKWGGWSGNVRWMVWKCAVHGLEMYGAWSGKSVVDGLENLRCMVWKKCGAWSGNVRCMVSESAVDGREKCGGEIGETSESLVVRHQDMTCVPTLSGFLVSWLRPLSTVQAAVAILFLPRCWDQHRDGLL
jgi:hypothetical protein